MKSDHAEVEGSTGIKKGLLERTGFELRRQAREGSAETKREARAELGRRRDNLRGAVIPAWELALRGPDPAKWDLVRA